MIDFIIKLIFKFELAFLVLVATVWYHTAVVTILVTCKLPSGIDWLIVFPIYTLLFVDRDLNIQGYDYDSVSGVQIKLKLVLKWYPLSETYHACLTHKLDELFSM